MIHIDQSLMTHPLELLPNHPDVPNVIPLTCGMIYKYQKANVLLPVHTHNEPDNTHTTAVMQGSIEVIRGNGQPEVYKAPAIVDFKHGEPHSIKSLEPNTIIYNPFKKEIKR